MIFRRKESGAVPRDYGDHRREPRGGYPWWEWAIVIGVVLLVIVGVVLLLRALLGSSDEAAEPTPSFGPVQPLQCPDELWFDVTINSCLPRAECTADQAYDEETNTCKAIVLTIASVSPATGSPAGGTELTIVGTGFVEGATVTVDGVPAEDPELVDVDTLVATTPPGNVFFPVDVTVTNPGGESVTADNVFAYDEPTVDFVTEVVPDTGSSQGGEAVIIKGRDFVEGAVVSFNARPATDVIVLNETTIRATIPAGPIGPVSVNVRNPGEEVRTLLDGFRYVDQEPRAVMLVRPARGAEAGGTKVTITGTGFEEGATVSFGGQEARKVKVVDSTKITAVTPPGKAGPVDVAVRNPGVPAAILTEGFAYVETALVETVEPVDGSELGGTKVTITGERFLEGATVTFGDAPATEVEVVNENRLTAVTPAGEIGEVDVAVANPEEPAGVAKKAFTYIPAAEAEARLPRCRPFTLSRISAPPGGSVILTADDIFPAARGIEGARLVDAVLVTRAPAPESGSITWRPEPPRIAWTAAATSGARGAILLSYEADSCRGTAEGLTIPVLTE